MDLIPVGRLTNMQAGMGLCGLSEFYGTLRWSETSPSLLAVHFISFLLLQINPLTKILSDDYDGGEVDERCQG